MPPFARHLLSFPGDYSHPTLHVSGTGYSNGRLTIRLPSSDGLVALSHIEKRGRLGNVSENVTMIGENII